MQSDCGLFIELITGQTSFIKYEEDAFFIAHHPIEGKFVLYWLYKKDVRPGI